MDLYRFFHPHHNPRLKAKRLRLQEISELELATKELLRALRRASLRINLSDSEESTENLFTCINALEIANISLNEMLDIYPEDTDLDLKDLLKERLSAPGWETWTRLVSERLQNIQEENLTPLHCENLNIENNSELKIEKIKT